MTDQKSVPPGWYEDPGMVDTLRYWDGDDWTKHAVPTPSRAKADFNGWKLARFVALGILCAAAILAILGSLLR